MGAGSAGLAGRRAGRAALLAAAALAGLWLAPAALAQDAAGPDASPPSINVTASAGGQGVFLSVYSDEPAEFELAAASLGGWGLRTLGAAVAPDEAHYHLAAAPRWIGPVQPHGPLAFTVSATDPSGNSATATEADLPEPVEVAAPEDAQPPSLTVAASASDGTAVVTVSSDEHAYFELVGATLGGEDLRLLGRDAISVQAHFRLAYSGHGPLAFTVNATDLHGNSAAATEADLPEPVEVAPPPDTTPPSIAVAASAEGGTVLINVTTDEPASILVDYARLGGAELFPNSRSTAPQRAVYGFPYEGHGALRFSVTATDLSGNSATATDADLPEPVAVAPPPDTAPPSITVSASLEEAGFARIAVTTDEPASIALNYARLGGAHIYPNARLIAAERAVYHLPYEGYGTLTFLVTATDAAGNSATATEADLPEPVALVPPDTTPPSLAAAATAEGGVVTITVTSDEHVTFDLGRVRVGDEDVHARGISTTADTAVYRLPHLRSGYLEFSVTATDAAGNSATATEADLPAPVRAGDPDVTPPSLFASAFAFGGAVVIFVVSDEPASFELGHARLGGADLVLQRETLTGETARYQLPYSGHGVLEFSVTATDRSNNNSTVTDADIARVEA